MDMQQQEEQEIQQQEWKPTWSNLSLAALGTFTTMGLEAAHNPELALLSGVLSVVATWKGDDAINFVSSLFSPQGRAELGTKLSRKSYALAQPKDDSNVTRILPEANNATYASFDLDDEEDIALPSQVKKNDGIFRFSELLASGFVPTTKKIFMGRTMDGRDIFIAAEDACHIALAGRTGGGKGSLMRLLMVQFAYIGAQMLLLNPHYMRWVKAKDGKEFDEDWTPFEGVNPRKHTKQYPNGAPYLVSPPIGCAKYETIGEYLEWAVKTLLTDRIEQGRDNDVKFKPYFIVIDEWPAIAGELKNAPGRLGKLLREARKYGIFLIVASQDFQVKTLGLEGSGGIRKCFITVYYTGGDATTARELLSEPGLEIKENELGKGIVYLKCAGTKNLPVLVRVPFVDNASVYKLLGPSTFKKVATQQNREVEIVEPQIDWTAEENDEPRTQAPKQEITLTLEQLLAIQGQGPLRVTDDLPAEETRVLRSPYYEHTAQSDERRVDQIPTMVQRNEQSRVTYQPTRRSSMALAPQLQQALDAYQRGYTKCRELAEEMNIGKTKAAELLQQLKTRKLI